MSNALTKINELKEVILSKLESDYAMAKKYNLHYCYSSYEDLVEKVKNLPINSCKIEEWKVEKLAESKLSTLNKLVNDMLDDSYYHATIRINLYSIQIDSIKRTVN